MKNYLLLIALSFFTNYLFSTNYLVSNINELDSRVNIVVPGDTIIMANGLWMDVEIDFDPTGVANNPIVLKAETPGQVIISGDARLRIGGDYLVVTGLKFENCIATSTNLIEFRRSSSELAHHSRLTETVVINCNPPDEFEDYKWVGIYGQNNEVDHCYIANKTHIGATLVVWSTELEGFHHIHHNFFGPRPRPVGDGNGYETIRVGTSSFAQNKGSNLVEHNYFYQTDGEIEIISGKSSFSTYRYNIFRNCRGGLTLRHGTNCRVEGNIFFGESKPGSYGLRIIDRDHLVINNYFSDLNSGGSSIRNAISIMSADLTPVASGVQHAIRDTIAYNTIVNCEKGITIGAGSDVVAPDSCVLFNNVVTIENSSPVTNNLQPTNIFYQGNFFHRIDGNVTVPPSGSVDIDPLLSLAVGDSIYRPMTTSPIIGAAIPNLVEEFQDFEGHTRANPATAGADEVSNEPPIERGIYGPTWLIQEQPVSSEFPTLVSNRIKLLSQQDNRQFGLYFPSDDLLEDRTASFRVYSLTGRLMVQEQLIKKGETIFLGNSWPAGQYLIHCKYFSENQELLKWIKW